LVGLPDSLIVGGKWTGWLVCLTVGLLVGGGLVGRLVGLFDGWIVGGRWTGWLVGWSV